MVFGADGGGQTMAHLRVSTMANDPAESKHPTVAIERYMRMEMGKNVPSLTSGVGALALGLLFTGDGCLVHATFVC